MGILLCLPAAAFAPNNVVSTGLLERPSKPVSWIMLLSTFHLLLCFRLARTQTPALCLHLSLLLDLLLLLPLGGYSSLHPELPFLRETPSSPPPLIHTSAHTHLLSLALPNHHLPAATASFTPWPDIQSSCFISQTLSPSPGGKPFVGTTLVSLLTVVSSTVVA